MVHVPDSFEAPVRKLGYGDALKREMAKRGLTARKVADFCKVSERTVKAWEANEEVPTHGQHSMVVHMMRAMRFIPVPPQKGKEPELLPKELMPAPNAKGATGPLVSFGEALRQEREAEELSHKDIAELLGVSPHAPANWEIGRGMHQKNYETLISVFPRLALHKAPALTTRGASTFKRNGSALEAMQEAKGVMTGEPCDASKEESEAERLVRLASRLYPSQSFFRLEFVAETTPQNKGWSARLVATAEEVDFASGLQPSYEQACAALLALLEKEKGARIGTLKAEAEAAVKRLQDSLKALEG